MRLQTKLILGLVTVLFLVGGGLFFLAIRASALYQQEVQQRLNAGLAAQVVKEYPLIRSSEVNREALEELFHQLMVVNPAIEVYLLDPAGEILAYSAPAGRVERARVSLAPIETLLQDRSSRPVLGDDPRDPDGRKVFDVAPVRHEGHLEGYLYVVLGGEAHDSVAGMLERSYILRLAGWVGLAILLSCLAATAVLTHRLTRPLGNLVSRIDHLAAAELDGVEAPRGDRGGDEVARLEASFEALANRIRQQIGELQRADRLRRELVASVSHDLRTPITHLQGYLDTLEMKGEELPPEKRREYVAIAARQAERLGRLVNDLFELAKLDALQAPVHPEEFDLPALVRDVVDKFELPARRRRVGLEMSAPASLPPVAADPGLIERTLENLVDNALRHTPAEGRVEIRLREEPERILVEVHDTGEGIPEVDRGRIFDRFYRGSRRDGEGSGLGLAIARRAVELHRGRLQVRSQEGRGSVFLFDLPRSTARKTATG